MISFHGISTWFALKVGDTSRAASPMISSARSTASWSFLFEVLVLCDAVRELTYRTCGVEHVPDVSGVTLLRPQTGYVSNAESSSGGTGFSARLLRADQLCDPIRPPARPAS